MNELKKRGHQAVGVDVEEMDITDEVAVNKIIKEINPDVVYSLCSMDGGGRCGR